MIARILTHGFNPFKSMSNNTDTWRRIVFIIAGVCLQSHNCGQGCKDFLSWVEKF